MPTTVLRDNGLSALLAGEIELLAQGFQFTEGPLELGDGSLLFQDIKAERTYLLPAGTTEAKVLREQTGAANGQTFGPDGWIYFCEQNGRRVSRMKPDARRSRPWSRSSTACGSTAPTTSSATPNGHLYFTDPPYGAPRPTAPCTSRASTASTRRRTTWNCSSRTSRSPTAWPSPPTSRSSTSATRPGITSAPSRSSPRGFVDPATGRVFAVHDPETQGGPDGMKVDVDGRVYVAVAQGVWVYEPDGRLLGIIPTSARPSNLAWRGQDGATLAITAVDKVHQIRLKISGVLPPLRPGA